MESDENKVYRAKLIASRVLELYGVEHAYAAAHDNLRRDPNQSWMDVASDLGALLTKEARLGARNSRITRSGWNLEEQMKQLPAPYWSEVHGPVFAYAARGDTRACCVTWRDDYVLLHHDELLPLPRLAGKPDVTQPGVEQVLDLAEAVGEAMAPHYDGAGGVKPTRPRRFNVGEAVLGGRPGKARDMMKDMLEIPGNKSFRETLIGLQERLRLRDRRPRAKPRRSELPRDQHDGENDA
jgi:hypothetical protein